MEKRPCSTPNPQFGTPFPKNRDLSKRATLEAWRASLFELSIVTASQPKLSRVRHQPADLPTLPPLSPLTYYRRNIWRVLPVAGAIVISVFLIAAIVTLLNSVDASIRTHYGSMRRLTILTPQFERDVPSATLARAAKFPDVRETMVAMPYFVLIKTVFGEMPVPIYGLTPKDAPKFVEVTGNRLAQGRLPKVNAAEIAFSRAWANNLGVKVGSTYTPFSERFPTLAEAQKVVGIFEGGENIAVTDKTYLQLTLPDVVQRPSYFYIPTKPEKLEAVSKNLRDMVDHPKKFGLDKDAMRYVRLFTYEGLVGELRKGLAFLYRFLAIADILVIGAVAMLSGFLANIYFEQRLGEFGLLSALGFRRQRLAKRLIIETGSLVIVSWVLGLLFTSFVFWLLDYFYMTPKGLVLASIGGDALLYTLPTPLLVGIASLATVLTRLYRLDPIEIMERR